MFRSSTFIECILLTSPTALILFAFMKGDARMVMRILYGSLCLLLWNLPKVGVGPVRRGEFPFEEEIEMDGCCLEVLKLLLS